jgi:outer membrane protein assembly factor BamD (BamD/ComL family)
VLKRARAALRAGEAGRAIALLDDHSRQRSSSALEAEATLLRIEALAQLGSRREASELAARFLRAYPNSALADRARSFTRSAAPSP